MVLRVPTEPKVILGEYRDIRLETPASELVTDEDVDKVLARIQSQNATWVPVEQPSELGHSVSISVTQKDGDTVIVENQSLDYELITVDNEGETIHPQNQMTAALVGLSDGETKTFAMHYPADYEETDVAGKEITFTVEVNGVKVKEVEPIDDEFAKAMSDKDSLAEWREELKETIQQQREMQRAHEVGQQVLDKVMEGLQLVEWPLSIEEQMIDQELTRQNQRLQEANLTLDAYYKMQNTTAEEWREQLRVEVAHRLKTGFVLSELAQKENVKITQTEVLERARYISQMSGLGDRIWQYILQSESYQQEIASELLADKTLLHLAKIAKGEVNGSSPEAIETAAVEEATPEAVA
jgi:trigger factor